MSNCHLSSSLRVHLLCYALSALIKMHRLRRLKTKHFLADEQAELDFQSLCSSFGESDNEDIAKRDSLNPSTRQPTASMRRVNTFRSSPSPYPPPVIPRQQRVAQHQHLIAPYFEKESTVLTADVADTPQTEPASPTFASLDDDGDDVASEPSNELLLSGWGGHDDAWWAAEYARRDAAFPREERARKACKQYYQRYSMLNCFSYVFLTSTISGTAKEDASELK